MNKLSVSEPLITSSPTIAALFAVISCQDFADHWVANNFNNLLFIQNTYENRCIFMEDQPSNRETVFSELNFFRYNRIKYDVVNYLNNNIVEFLCKSIDNQYYIRIALDNFYISANEKVYSKKHHLHPLFIYGYDDEKKMFLVGEFFNQKKFDYYSIPFDEVEKAYGHSVYPKDETEEYLENIILLKLDDAYVPEPIQLEKIVEETQGYLCGKDTSNKYKYRRRKRESFYYFGIECYNQFINSIVQKCADTRSAHVILDRIKILAYKLDILYRNGKINREDFEKLNSAIAELETEALKNRNLLLKILLKYEGAGYSDQDAALLKEKYEYLKKKEKQYLESFVDAISKKIL